MQRILLAGFQVVALGAEWQDFGELVALACHGADKVEELGVVDAPSDIVERVAER